MATGIAFRASSGFVTDATDDTYSIGEVYPVTRKSTTFGWDASMAGNSRDRLDTNPAKLAGMIYKAGDTGSSVFTVDLPSAGEYTIRLAIGDVNQPCSNQKIVIKDTSTTLSTITGASLNLNSFMDATGVDRATPAAWLSNNVGINLTFSTTKLVVEIGGVTGGGLTALAYLSFVPVGGGGTTVTANLGAATASGFAAAILAATVIACSMAGGTASGNTASVGVGSGTTISASLGSATASGHQASVASSGTATITTDVFKNNTGTVLASTTIPKLTALKLSDMTLAASWTNQTTNGSGVLTLAGAMTVATDYLLVVSSTDGASAGVKKYTAA